jgi:hypothetical protein
MNLHRLRTHVSPIVFAGPAAHDVSAAEASSPRPSIFCEFWKPYAPCRERQRRCDKGDMKWPGRLGRTRP